ncbi:hypothetical protein Tco_1317861 [Tanacetum coccineum]
MATLWRNLHWTKTDDSSAAFATTRESARDVYSKRRIIAVTKVEIVEWQNYKHLDWITKVIKFSSVKERIAFNVSLRMFTRSVVIQRRVEDLQLGVESYQKKLNLTKPDTYKSNLDGRDDVMTDVILPQVQATQEIEDTHVTLTPVNPDGQQQSSSVSSGFVSNMLNPNQDTGVDDIFGQHTEATSLIDTPVTAIVEPSFSAPTNPVALEDNFSELRQTNQYAEALSSIPGIVDQYLANKMQEAVDVAVQLKYDKIREESNTANQQFLDSIDEGMKKIIKEQVQKEVSKITPKIEKLVIDQLESEVLVRSSKKANTSHAVAANLSELELKRFIMTRWKATTLSTIPFEAPAHQEFETGVHDEQVEEESVPAVHESVQPWLSNLAQRQDPRESFDELTDSTFDFSAFVMNRLNVQTLTPELLAGPTFELMKGTCKSLTELEYFCEEVYKATTEKLDFDQP